MGVLSLSLSSCTSYRALEDERAKTAQADKARAQMQMEYDAMKLRMDSTEEERVKLNKMVAQMRKDTANVNANNPNNFFITFPP